MNIVTVLRMKRLCGSVEPSLFSAFALQPRSIEAFRFLRQVYEHEVRVANHVGALARRGIGSVARGARADGSGGFLISTSVIHYMLALRCSIWRTASPLGSSPIEHYMRGLAEGSLSPVLQEVVERAVDVLVQNAVAQ
eukprot:1701284-Amphidinium_carterae.4